MFRLKLFILLILGLSFAVLAIQNPNTIQLKFLTWQTQQISLIGIILMSVLVGSLCGLVFSPMHRSERRKEIQKDRED